MSACLVKRSTTDSLKSRSAALSRQTEPTKGCSCLLNTVRRLGTPRSWWSQVSAPRTSDVLVPGRLGRRKLWRRTATRTVVCLNPGATEDHVSSAALAWRWNLRGIRDNPPPLAQQVRRQSLAHRVGGGAGDPGFLPRRASGHACAHPSHLVRIFPWAAVEITLPLCPRRCCRRRAPREWIWRERSCSMEQLGPAVRAWGSAVRMAR